MSKQKKSKGYYVCPCCGNEALQLIKYKDKPIKCIYCQQYYLPAERVLITK